MVLPIVRDMEGRVIQDANGPVSRADGPEFSMRTWRAEFDGGIVRVGPYVTPRIVQNFLEHTRPFLPAGTIIRINGFDRIVSLEFPDQRTHIYTYEAIDASIVMCIDHLKSITEGRHDSHAQTSSANTDDQASSRAPASVVPAPGSRRLILGRIKVSESGKG